MDIEKRLRMGNSRFQKHIFINEVRKNRINELSQGQKPFAIVITCSDSRVIPEEIFSCIFGDLFVIRTAGNVINEGELASIEYGIEHLNIEYVLVLAHTHCGAVHAAIHNEKGRYLSPILDNIKKAVSGECDERQASIKNAINQVEYIKSKFPQFKGIVKSALYDIETCEVIF